jgi:transcription elongation factor Elf1
MDYESFMEEYGKNHKCCPVCGSKNYSTTLVGCIFDNNHPDAYVDRNRVSCHNCGWVGIRHQMVPEEITGVDLIAIERKRQINKERFDSKHDNEHVHGELANAAASYAMEPEVRDAIIKIGPEPLDNVPLTWPFGEEWWKPTPNDRIRELTKAGALIAAEIDRLLDKQNKEAAN